MQGKMRTKNESKPERDAAIGRRYALELIVSMADTTWRMLVPAGLWADLKWGTKPWLTLVGLLVGLSLSVLLVRAQLRGGR
jgi:F0F1-type ATP synthase assembly protein I